MLGAGEQGQLPPIFWSFMTIPPPSGPPSGLNKKELMHILVTNDDGVWAPGLLALAQEMRKLGRVTILGPDRN